MNHKGVMDNLDKAIKEVRELREHDEAMLVAVKINGVHCTPASVISMIQDEETIQEVLLVGGDSDGERINMVRKVSYTVHPTKGGVYYERYNRVGGIPVFLISTESPDNLIPLLIAGYGGKG